MLKDFLRRRREKLQRVHGRREFSQAAVARKLDVNRSYISRVESGRETPSRVFLIRISKLYDIDKRIILAIGGFLTRSVSRKLVSDPIFLDWAVTGLTLDTESLQELHNIITDQTGREILEKLARNRLFGDVLSQLNEFSTSELKALKDELQSYR